MDLDVLIVCYCTGKKNWEREWLIPSRWQNSGHYLTPVNVFKEIVKSEDMQGSNFWWMEVSVKEYDLPF